MAHWLEPWTKTFLTYLKHEVRASPNTIAAYTRDIKRFVKWVTDERLTRFDQFTTSKLGEYVEFLSLEQLSPASIARHVASLKVFFRYLVMEEQMTSSAADLLNRPGIWSRVPQVLSDRQVAAVLDTPDPANKLYWRDAAILALMAATGMRVSELANLKLDQVDLDQRTCRCVGKGNKERIVPFDPDTGTILRNYIQTLRPYLVDSITKSPHLFLSRSGKGLSRVDLWKLVRSSIKTVGLSGKLTPHSFRHSFATRLLSRGVDLRVIQELLGHSNIATTQHYTKVDASRLKRIHELFHPRG